MKKLTAIIISAILVAALAGCAQQTANVNPVGFDAAKAAALEAAGVTEAEASFDEASLKEYKGHQYYEIEFDANGREYEYYIEALTGVVITPEMAVQALGTDISVPTGEKQPADGKDAVKAEEGSQPAAADDKQSAEPKAEASTAPDVSAAADTSKADSKADTSAQLIGESKAKAIALSHAGKKEADVTFVKPKLDRDDGRVVYEVEFYSKDYVEYDYDIDAYSGTVLSFDYDAEDYKKPEADKPSSDKPANKPSDSGTSNIISEAKAKEIALAQVPGAKASDIREFEVDRDDGRVEYEGKIVFDGVEYEFEIDGYSGAIRSWDVEAVERYDRYDDDDDRYDDDDDRDDD